MRECNEKLASYNYRSTSSRPFTCVIPSNPSLRWNGDLKNVGLVMRPDYTSEVVSTSCGNEYCPA